MATEAASLFRLLAKLPDLKSAKLADFAKSVISVNSVWTQRCLVKNEVLEFSRTFTVEANDLRCTTISPPSIAAESVWNVSSPSGKKTAVVRKNCTDKKKSADEKFYFEIWSAEGLCERVFDVTSCEKHGGVYANDGAFGSLSWNSAENKLAYVAEKKEQKTTSYFAEPTKAAENEKPVAGSKFLYKEDWGETFVGKRQSVICVLDITSGEVTVLEGQFIQNSSCGQVVWCPKDNSLVFLAFHHRNVKLGLHYCPIRESTLYHFSLDSKILRSLTKAKNISVKSPRFSPDGSSLAYLQCEAGGTHMRGQSLRVMDWKTGESRVVVDVVNSPGKDDVFQGLYMVSLPISCWLSDNKHVILSTPCKSRQDIYAVNVSTGAIERLTSLAGCWLVEDIQADHILASISTIDTPKCLAIAKVRVCDDVTNLTWSYLEKATCISGLRCDVIEHTSLTHHPHFGPLTFESIVVQPDDTKSKGLIVFPHGGPHTVLVQEYMLTFAFLVKCGFTLALVNYRGSVGFGEDSVKSVLGHIGEFDIEDVQQLTEKVLEKYKLNRDKVVVYGGSHGGFIAAQLIAQYPEFYKAAVMRNPVTNLVSMVSLTDIPDWIYVESGYNEEYVPCTPPTNDLYKLLHSKSPVANIDQVKTPAMIVLGEGDKRVPPSQGIEYYKALKAKGVDTRLLMYPDNGHAILSVEAESDSMLNVYHWFTRHLSAEDHN